MTPDAPRHTRLHDIAALVIVLALASIPALIAALVVLDVSGAESDSAVSRASCVDQLRAQRSDVESLRRVRAKALDRGASPDDLALVVLGDVIAEAPDFQCVEGPDGVWRAVPKEAP